MVLVPLSIVATMKKPTRSPGGRPPSYAMSPSNGSVFGVVFAWSDGCGWQRRRRIRSISEIPKTPQGPENPRE